MAKKQRTAILLTVLALVLLAPVQHVAAAVPTGGVVHFHDYLTPPNDTNCTTNVAPKFRLAEADWRAMQRSGGGGEFDLGAGCYLISGPIHLGDTSPTYGNVHGAGDQLTTFKAASGFRLLEVDDFQGGEIHDFTLTGPGKGSGTGIVFAAQHRDLGTCCATISNIRVQDFGTCWQYGDDSAPNGAAAELVVTNGIALRCHIGKYYTQFNTIDILEDKPGVLLSDFGFYNNVAQDIRIRGGSSTGNVTDVYNGATGSLSIEGFRAEPASGVTRGPAVILSGNNPQQVTIRDSDFYVSTPSTATTTPAIQVNTVAMLTLSGNRFDGPIVVSGSHVSIVSANNQYRTVNFANPFQIPAGADNHLDSVGDFQPAGSGGFGVYLTAQRKTV